jgi:hypothetical protein
MRISDAFPGSYLKAPDLQGRTVSAAIAEVRLEDLGGEEKPVLYFQGKDRGLVLNKTNAGALVSAYGDETTAWTGQRVELFVARVMFQGRMVDGIRVRVPAPAPQATPPQMSPPHAASMAAQAPGRLPTEAAPFDDDIPF